MDTKTKFTHFVLKLVNAKKLASKMMLKPKRSKKFKFPRRLNKYQHDRFLVHQRNVVTFASEKSTTNKHIVFLHGGGYTVEVQNSHWWLMEKLVTKAASKLTFIEYPLAPEYNYKQAHEMLANSYTELCRKHPDDDFYLLGDSAGGGFGLAFAQILRENKSHKRPAKIALLSPWLDLSMGNSDIKAQEPFDLLLSTETLLNCANLYSDGLELKAPILSPLYGELNDLSSIAVFVGSNELFLPDCRLLKQKIEATDTTLFYKEYSGMQHDFILFPIKERYDLLKDILEYFE